MSTRGATPSATPINESQVSLNDSQFKVVNLQDVLETLHTDASDLPAHVRDFLPSITTTYKKLMNDEKACRVHLHPTGFMRSATLRPDWEEHKTLPFVERHSDVDRILVQQMDTLAKVNSGPVNAGVRYSGINGRVYGSLGEQSRYVEVIHGFAGGESYAPGTRTVHKPSLEGLAVVAANFSDVTEASLRKEYQHALGAPHQSLLAIDDRSKIFASLNQITANLSPTICAQYGFDPRKLNLLPGDPNENRPEYLVFPTEFLDTAVTHIIQAKDNLKHMNPIVDGTQFYAEFLPVDLPSWQKFDEHPLYKLWAEQEVLEQELNKPVTISHFIQMTILPDDEQTKQALKSRIQ